MQHIAGYALTRPVLVDLTADETAPALEQALTHGMDLVLANKRPLAGRRGGERDRCGRRPARAGAGCCTRPRSAPGSRSSTPTTS